MVDEWGFAFLQYNVVMRYQVPQFIEVEDKMFGPFTLKQFIYLAGGAGLSFVLYTLIPFRLVSVPLILAVMAFSATLAFFRMYNRFPFSSILESAFKYYASHKLYIWKKQAPKVINPIRESDIDKETAREYASIMVPKISNSKLKDLTWSLDIKDSIYQNYTDKKR